MAFDFLGTIDSIEKFEEFEEFVRIESEKIDEKIVHLTKEKSRLNELLVKFKTADATLRQEYPKSERADIDYIKKPRPKAVPKITTIDAVNAIDVEDLKTFTKDQIKFKRERNEFKIKKIRDLMGQIEDEIAFLAEKLENFEDNLSSIRSRFDLPDFKGNQRVASLDPKDVDPTIPVTRRDQGREKINGVTLYLILAIRANNKTIVFETAAPPLKPYQQITLLNGSNNGTVTVSRVINEQVIEVFEDLLEENPSPSKAILEGSVQTSTTQQEQSLLERLQTLVNQNI